MNDIALQLMTGVDITIPSCNIILHQPSLKEISFIGEKTFYSALQMFCINKSMFIQDLSELDNYTNFEIFINLLATPEGLAKKADIQKMGLIVFPKYKILFTPRSMLFKCEDQTFIVDEKNFDDLQIYLKKAFCLENISSDQSTFNPKDEAARKIAEKIMRNRERVAAQKEAQSSTSSQFAQYISVLTIGLNSMSLQDAINLTVYQLHDLIQRYGLYMSWDIDVRSRLAGGKPESKPDDWMKEIH